MVGSCEAGGAGTPTKVVVAAVDCSVKTIVVVVIGSKPIAPVKAEAAAAAVLFQRVETNIDSEAKLASTEPGEELEQAVVVSSGSLDIIWEKGPEVCPAPSQAVVDAIDSSGPVGPKSTLPVVCVAQSDMKRDEVLIPSPIVMLVIGKSLHKSSVEPRSVANDSEFAVVETPVAENLASTVTVLKTITVSSGQRLEVCSVAFCCWGSTIAKEDSGRYDS